MASLHVINRQVGEPFSHSVRASSKHGAILVPLLGLDDVLDFINELVGLIGVEV